jgi:hypothetical protein
MLQISRSLRRETTKISSNAVFPASRAFYSHLTMKPFSICCIYSIIGIHLQNCECIRTQLFEFFGKRLLCWETRYAISLMRHARSSRRLRLTRNTKPEPALLLGELPKSLLPALHQRPRRGLHLCPLQSLHLRPLQDLHLRPLQQLLPCLRLLQGLHLPRMARFELQKLSTKDIRDARCKISIKCKTYVLTVDCNDL